MLATGGFLVCVALLTLGVVAPIFRSANPPRWATRGWVGEVVTLAIVCTLALGLGYLGAGAIEAFQTGPDYRDLGLLAGVVFVAVVLWRSWRARARPRSLETATDLRAVAPESRDAAGGPAAAERATASASQPPPPHRAA